MRPGILFITHNIDKSIFLAEQVIIMSANPGSIKSEIRINMAYPRSRTSSEFGQLYEQIGRELHG